MLRELYGLSESWNRLGKRKKQLEAEGLWSRLMDACYNAELEFLKQQGIPEKSLKKLVRREQAWWEPDSRQFETGLVAPQFYRSVPVVVVQREAGFRIHDEILGHLSQHPVFAEDIGGAGAGSPREAFMNTLGSVEAVAQEYCFNDWEYFPSPEELEGPDRLALECMLAGLKLESMLAPIETGGGVFLNDEAPTHGGEELAWLDEAKKGGRLWMLLNAAVELGQSLHHYATFQNPHIEDAIRRMCTAGRPTTEEGEAVERIIRTAKDAGLTKPTPNELLKWLKGQRPQNDDDPLDVVHPLWVAELAGISWTKFENLVKSAGRRSSPK